MRRRNRWALGLALLLLPATAAASGPLTVDDVLRLHFAGVSEEIILSEIIVTETVFDLSVDEILRLQEAGISDRLLRFMVDTARSPGGELSEDSSGADESLEPYGEEEAGEVWANEIEEEEPTTVYNTYVSLAYAYPTWWYDFYWWDYWYYDIAYFPYRCGWAFGVGVWYPAWWGYRWCWAPAWWGYWGAGWYAGYGYGIYPVHYYVDPYVSARSRWHHDPSRVKYKRGHTGGGKPLYADAGLRIRDGSRLPVRGARIESRRRPRPEGRLALGDRPGGGRKDGLRRPVRTLELPDRVGGARGPRRPAGSGRTEERPSLRKRRPTGSVRSPAPGGRPVKVRKPEGAKAPAGLREPKPHRSGEGPAANPPKKPREARHGKVERQPKKPHKSAPAKPAVREAPRRPDPRPRQVRQPPRRAPRPERAPRAAPRPSKPRARR